MNEQPFKPGDKVVRFTDFEFDPDLKPKRIYTIDKCYWSVDKWMLKLKGRNFDGYDPTKFRLAKLPKDSPPVAIADLQSVYEVFDDIHGESLGIFATLAAAQRGTASNMETNKRLEVEFLDGTLTNAKMYYDIVRHEIKQ